MSGCVKLRGKGFMLKDTIAYLAFTGQDPHNEKKEDAQINSLAFNTWYSSLDISRIVYALQMRDAQTKEWFPLVAAIDPAMCSVQTVIETLFNHFNYSSNAPYLPFIFTPDPGASHYVAGLLTCFNEEIHLYIFDPLGSEGRKKRLKEALSPLKRAGLSLHFFHDAVQNTVWEGDGIFSCGPLCVEFIKSVLDHPEWVEKLGSCADDDLSVGNFFEPLFIDEASYIRTILKYRQEHADLLNRLDDAQLKPAFEVQRVLTTSLRSTLDVNHDYDFDFEDDVPRNQQIERTLESNTNAQASIESKEVNNDDVNHPSNQQSEDEFESNTSAQPSIESINDQTEERGKLNKLTLLCHQYLNYAFRQLEQDEEVARAADTMLVLSYNEDEKITSLKEKYNMVKKLHDIAIDPKATVRDFEDELNHPDCKILLNHHRDNIFSRLIANLWGIIAAIPRMLFYSSPTGFFNHPYFWRSHSEELHESLKDIIEVEFVQ